MLVLSRVPGQAIYVGEAKIIFLGRNGDKLKVGIEAPRDIPIYREELKWRQMEQQLAKYKQEENEND